MVRDGLRESEAQIDARAGSAAAATARQMADVVATAGFLLDVAYRYRSAEETGDAAGAAETAAILRQSPVHASLGVVLVSTADADGWLTPLSRSDVKGISIREREDFILARRIGKDAYDQETFTPGEDLVTGRPVVRIDRPYFDRAGHFAGIVAVSIDVQIINAILARLGSDAGSIMTLGRLSDGVILARSQPLPAGMAWPARHGADLVALASENLRGTTRRVSALTGRDVILGYRVMPGRPLFVTASLDVKTELATVDRMAWLLRFSAGLLVLSIVIGTALFWVWQARQRGMIALAATQQRAATIEAARTELERLVTGLPVAAFHGYLAPDGRFTLRYLTPNVLRLTGRTKEQLLDFDAFLALISPEYRSLVASSFIRAAAEGEAATEFPLRHSDGSLRWFRQNIRVDARMETGTELIGTLSDFTAEHAMTEQVAADEARFRGFLEASPDAIVITGENGQIVLASPRVTDLFGYDPADLIGKPHNMLVPERHRDAHACHMDGYLRGPQARAMGFGNELHGLRRDGTEFAAEISLSPYRDATGLFVIASVRDITRRLDTEEQLRQAQKMMVLGQLTGGIAHDFNNLLTTILGNLELLEWDDRAFDAEARALLAAIRRASKQAETLTQQLLAFSRKQPLKPEVIDVNEVIGGMADLLRRTLGQHVTVEVVRAGGLWQTNIDPNQFESAILNLAINARDAMASGGRLSVETGNALLDEDYAAAHAEVKAGQYVMVAISDDGMGMSQETLERAFEPFYTTKDIGRGSGLGLSQVYGFVKQSGGHIKLYSEVAQGTTVRIYLPRHLAGGRPEKISTSEQDMDLLCGTETVLLVEDEAAVRKFVTTALTRLGYTVLAADTADAALAILEREPGIALLFTDVGLPGVNGKELADEAWRRRAELKVLFTTGYARNAFVHNGTLDQGVNLLTKPFTIQSLGKRIKEVLGRQG